MKKIVIFFTLILFVQFLNGQCECIDCPVFIPSNAFRTSTINISGSTNDILEVNGQGLCRVCIDVTTDAIKELQMDLIAPNGSTINLMDDSGINVNADMVFNICFVACSATPSPDPTHAAVFNTDDNWDANSSYNGSYYPFQGCLEDLSGSVNGNWTLRAEDDTFFDETIIVNWYLIFDDDDDGIGCANSAGCNETCEPDAGTIALSANALCPTATLDITINGYNQNAPYIEYILIVDQYGMVVDIAQGDNYSFTSNQCGEFMVYSYNRKGAAPIPLIGDMVSSYDCVVNCCDLINDVFSFIDADSPTFTFVPENPNSSGGTPTEIFCLADILPDPSADFTDNCIGDGSVAPIIIDQTNPCNGGTYIRRWEVRDSCNLTPTVVEQFIIIEPTPEAEFLDPPDDKTIDCDEGPTSETILDYTNGLVGTCAINGSVFSNSENNYNACGGEIEVTWNFTDDCGRFIDHLQIITVNEAAEPMYLDPPDDITISCDDIPAAGPTLEISNNETGLCEITALIIPTVIDNTFNCSGEVILEWDYRDICGRNYTYRQTITVQEGPEIQLDITDARICEGDRYELLDIEVTDINNTEAAVSYHSASPPNINNTIPTTLVSPSTDTEYFILLTADDGGSDFASFTVFVDPLNDVANNGSGNVCNDETNYNLFEFLTDVNVTSGRWLDLDNTGVVLDNPNQVNFNNISPGQYRFSYQVNSTNSCPPDTAVATIQVFQNLDLNLISISCSSNLNTYSVNLNASGDATLSVNDGIINNLGGGNYSVEDIALTTILMINGTSINACEDSLIINPPNCDCPTVDPPTNNGDLRVCVADLPVSLSVSLTPNQTAAWYSEASGGTLLDSATLTFTPNMTTPDTYIYYVSSIDLDNPTCVSSIRTPVQLTINPLPVINNAVLSACNGGNVEFDLSTANAQITNNPLHQLTYHQNMIDAETGNNPLNNVIEITNGLNQNLFVRVIDSENCFSNASIRLELLDLPSIVLSTNGIDTILCNNPMVNISSEGSSRGPSLNYIWYNEDGPIPAFNGLSTITVNNGGWHYLEIIETNSLCQNIDSIFIYQDVNSPNIELDNSINGPCGDESVILNANISSNGPTSILWTTILGEILSDPTLASIEVMRSSTYYITVENQESNCIALDSIIFNTLPSPSLISLDVEDDDCSEIPNGRLLFTPLDQSNLPFSYIINGIAYNQNEISNLSANSYQIEILDANGCALDTMAIISSPSNFELSLPSTLIFSLNFENILEASVNITDDQIASVQWSPVENLSCSDCLNPILSDPEISIYTVQVVDINGCVAARSIQIEFLESSTDIFIPNVFSPNGDNINDYLLVNLSNNLNLSNLEMQIYDRWGNQVYEQDQLQNVPHTEFWDGTYKGQRMNSGVFIYSLKATLANTNEIILIKGDVTLIR